MARQKECPKCQNPMVIQDDSFDYGEGHHGPAGTETILYWVCTECSHDQDYEGDEDDE